MICEECKDTGVIETGNNDLPCNCPAGDTAKFNVAGVGLVTGREVKQHYLNDSPDPRRPYMDKYYVITVTEDGDVYVNEHTRQEILDDLKAEDSGLKVDEIFSGMPEEMNPMNWNRTKENKSTLIIKGKVVSPKAVKVVEEFDI